MNDTTLNEEKYTASNGVEYIHRTYACGYAVVIRDGELVRITHGDPEFDAWNARVNDHMKASFRRGR